ncbi:Hypothetical protein I596_3800 [Dokdonella koreensis DS-123]|uniref:Uncharacterized protein n=1 Tax=Dokdonella koreensis DS-123 TaxID=1300342 RepID=A0A167HBR3_9GAMM|nr:Hypothetical protein I596_3800 [Dokdonella koreensis DS-123]
MDAPVHVGRVASAPGREKRGRAFRASRHRHIRSARPGVP